MIACGMLRSVDDRIGLGRFRSHRHSDSRSRESDTATRDDPAFLDQLLERGVRQDDDACGLSASNAARNGILSTSRRGGVGDGPMPRRIFKRRDQLEVRLRKGARGHDSDLVRLQGTHT